MANEMFLATREAVIGPDAEAIPAALEWIKIADAAMAASEISFRTIFPELVAIKAPTIPARTSPVPAVDNHGVDAGNSMRSSGEATTLELPFSKTVTANSCEATTAHFFGS